VIELLLPELRKRGLFWDDYFVPGGAYRENVRSEKGAHPAADHPAALYQWRAGVSKEDAVIPPEPEKAEDVVAKAEEVPEANSTHSIGTKAKSANSNGVKANGSAKKRSAEAPGESDRAKRRSTRNS
jgi:hypothetical protein